MAIRPYDETFHSGVGYIMSSDTNQTISQWARHDTINNQTKPIRKFTAERKRIPCTSPGGILSKAFHVEPAK